MKRNPNRKTKIKLNKIILQVLLLILVLAALITQKDSILNILTNKSKIKAGIPAGMKVGDIIKYDHKTGVDPNLLKTTIGKGTASIPGSTYEQTFDASTINTTWHVWSIDRDKDEIMIVSDNVAPFKTYGAIDYIWYEHNMHQIASIFGHGKGAKKKNFTYKVGSQLEDTEDTATWKTGPGGIPKTSPEGIPDITEDKLEKIEVPMSGARPLRTEDIEKAFGWTASTIKSDSKFIKNEGSNKGYGGIHIMNVHFPQRDTGISTQKWADKNIAKAKKQDVKVKDGYYDMLKANVPENTYNNILWEWNNWNGSSYYQIGKFGISADLGHLEFRLGWVTENSICSSAWDIIQVNDSNWTEHEYMGSTRIVAFLSSSSIEYQEVKDAGTHQEPIWEIIEKEKLKVGDIVNYDHKDVLRIEDARNNIDGIKTLKTTIEEGTASTPGSTFKQDFDGNKIDTKWRVWGVDEETGDVIILSDNVAPFETGNAIDYIWYEHNMHQIASIFGHGKGVKKKAFEYKVGSQLEDTGDTAIWKTGPGGIPGITQDKLENIEIPLSGARPLKTKDIEDVFEWDESKIKADDSFHINGDYRYGEISLSNINFPQRDTGNNSQQWEDKTLAVAKKKEVKAKNSSYAIMTGDIPRNIYRNILWDWNGEKAFQLGANKFEVQSRSSWI